MQIRIERAVNDSPNAAHKAELTCQERKRGSHTSALSQYIIPTPLSKIKNI